MAIRDAPSRVCPRQTAADGGRRFAERGTASFTVRGCRPAPHKTRVGTAAVPPRAALALISRHTIAARVRRTDPRDNQQDACSLVRFR